VPQHCPRQTFIDLGEQFGGNPETVGRSWVVIASAFEERADILDSEAIFQQQNHPDESDRNGIELQAGPHSVDGVIRAFQGPHKRLSNPIFVLGDDFSAAVAGGNHRGSDKSLVAHRALVVAFLAVVACVALVNVGGLLCASRNLAFWFSL
jgi:hypothetical protein